MASKTYYFKHDYNARNDLKMKRLIKNFGAPGYGFYWYLIEMLHEDEDSILTFSEDDIDVIADDLSSPLLTISAETIQAMLLGFMRFKLIDYSSNTVSSKRVFKNKEKNVSILEMRKEIGARGGRKKAENAKKLPIATDVLPIATDVLPIATDVLPIATDVLPIATDVLPIATDVLPIATDTNDINSPQEEGYQKEIYEVKSATKKTVENVGTIDEVLPKPTKPSKLDNTTTTKIHKNTLEESSSSLSNGYDGRYYNISVPLRISEHTLENCLWNYVNNSEFKAARGMHCIRLNLDPNPEICLEKIVPWAEAFNRGLVNDGLMKYTMDRWITHFPNWTKKVIENRGYINPEILFTAEDINSSAKQLSVKEKKSNFKDTLDPFLEKYGKTMLNDFFRHWAEPDTTKKLLRWETEKTWDVSMRLVTWYEKSLKFNK